MALSGNAQRIVIVTGFLGLINGIQRFLLPIALISYGWDLGSYGTIYFIQALGMSLPLIFGGFSTDLRGRRLTIIISFATFAIGSYYFSSVISGSSLIALIIAQVITTISVGISRMGLSIQMADETLDGQDRTNSLGIQAGIRNTMGFLGPLIVGYLLDNYLDQFLGFNQFEIGFIFLAILGLLGIFLSLILPQTDHEFLLMNKATSIMDLTSDQKTMQIAFGIEEVILGFTSGMVVPFIDYYILTEFTPTTTVWGVLVAIGNIGIAIGSFIGGRYAENVGKIKTIMFLYLFVPLVAAGIAFGVTFNQVSLFYLLRIVLANLVHPVWESWYFSKTISTARGRLLSFIQLSRRLSRAVGSASGPLVYGLYGPVIFPIACLFYPLAMAIPAYFDRIKSDHET